MFKNGTNINTQTSQKTKTQPAPTKKRQVYKQTKIFKLVAQCNSHLDWSHFD